MPFFKEYLGYKSDRKIPAATKQELITKIGQIQNPKHKALFAFMYLVGGRIEEIVGYPAKEYDPIMKHQIEEQTTKDNKQLILIRNVRTLKTGKTNDFRNIPVSVEREKEFIEMITPHLIPISDNSPVFNYNRTYVWQLAKRYFGKEWFPHWFRHTRATRLAEDYNFTSNDLVQFFGWKDIRRTVTYVHLNWETLAKKM